MFQNTNLHSADQVEDQALLSPGTALVPVVPEPAPISASAAFLQARERVPELQRRVAAAEHDEALAKAEAAEAGRHAEKAEVDWEIQQISGPEVDAARQAASDAALRHAEVQRRVSVLKRAVDMAERKVFDAIPAAQAEVSAQAEIRMQRAKARYAELVPELAAIAGEIIAMGDLLGAPFWREMFTGIPAELTFPRLAATPTPPADAEAQALAQTQMALQRAEAAEDRFWRRQEAAQRAAKPEPV
jgi:hypothetical protein